MTLNDSMDSAAFKVFISKCLVPQLWKGAVMVMDNLPAHKVKAIAIELRQRSHGLAFATHKGDRAKLNQIY